jgi:thioester reductase-like protein
MGYLLLTGATGLLGRYVLRDALRAGIQVAVLARHEASLAARARIDTILREAEDATGPAHPRPVVLQGDLRLRNCGLDRGEMEWMARNCLGVINCAASLSFRDSADGEPRRTNVEGTRQLLALCKATGIRTVHHVSTAYVAGQRTGRVHEHELDVGQQFSNAYERSKCESEQLLRQSPDLECVTIFRPSIIVGDSCTGHTTCFHGFYKPLQLGLALARSAKGKRQGSSDSYLQRLGLRGHEQKNLVPVDWVSAVLLHVVRHPDLHGGTYHLASDQPVSVQDIDEAITAAIDQEVAKIGQPSRPAPGLEIQHDGQFVEQMSVYREYFRDDPEFDTSNTRRAAPHVPCPVLDRRTLMGLAQYAIDVDFGWPRPVRLPPKVDAEQQLEKLNLAPSWSTVGALGLDVLGPGGGQWQLEFNAGQPVACGFGLNATGSAVAHLHIETLASLVRGQLNIDRAIDEGRLVLLSRDLALSTADDWLRALLARMRQRPSRSRPSPKPIENAR